MITSTKIVFLRYHLSTDVRPLFDDYTSDIASTKYLARKPHNDIDQTNHMLQKLSSQSSLASFGKCIWVICDKNTEAPVGYLTLVKQANMIELHVGIRKSCKRLGYGTKALSIAAKHLVSNHITNKVTSFTDIEHIAAQSAFEKAGFSRTLRQNEFYIAPQLGSCRRDVYRYEYTRNFLTTFDS